MGMFDNVRCEYPLPPGDHASPYQTKDLACELDTYTIKSDGTLWGEEYDREGWSRSNVRPRFCDNFTGEVRFYCTGVKDASGWWEFSAYFVNGRLKELHQIVPEIAAAPKLAGEE